jgi:penicillin-binding protein 2
MNENRKFYVNFAFLVVGLVFLIKLFFIQVLNTNYVDAAERNIVQRIIEYPYRGLLYDREGKLIVYNNPVYDIQVIPSEVFISDTTAFCELIGITREEFDKKMDAAKKYSWVKPTIFLKQISNMDFARIQDNLYDFKGFYPAARTVRSYTSNVLANALGYIAEISPDELRRDTIKYYRQGDYIGKSGLEYFYEKELRGKRGVKYKMVNVRGIDKGAFKGGQFDTASVPGMNLESTIDLDLQNYVEKLLQGKTGSVVAIEPSTGEILAIASSPSYNPNDLTGREYSRNMSRLQTDSTSPLFNRPLMAMYPPGSMFKSIQALIALQENVLQPHERIYCDGSLIGDHAPPGYYDVVDGIKHSSNNYFYKVFKRIINQEESQNTFIDSRIGLEKWRKYVEAFGLGKPLLVDIPNASGGYIPTVNYYDKIYGENRWKFSTIYSLSIGQGEMLVTPLQMANLAALIANRGYFYQPHLVKSIGNKGNPLPMYRQKNHTGIDSVHFDAVVEAMAAVVESGTGQYRAKLKNIEVCGKTSTVENPHGEDHSGFIAFAPRDNPKIAISAYIENAGQGARAAAAISSLAIEQYLLGKTERPRIEEYVLKGNFN